MKQKYYGKNIHNKGRNKGKYYDTKTQIRKYYDIRAVADHKYHTKKVFQILDKYHPYAFYKSLDIACADGGTSIFIKNKFGIECHGIDLSPHSVKLANKNGIIAQVHDIREKLPYRDNMFDLVIGLEIIEHVLDTDHFIAEVHRVMRKNGICIITTPNLCSFTNRMRVLFGQYTAHGCQWNAEKGHHIVYTMPTLVKHFEQYKFKIIKKTCSSIPFPMYSKKVPEAFKQIAMKLGDYFYNFGSHIIIVARK